MPLHRAFMYIAAAAVFFLDTATHLHGEPPSAAKGGDDLSQLEEKPFTDTKSGITLRLPKGWTTKKGIEHTGYEAPVKDKASGGSLAPNVVLALDSQPGIKPENLAAVVKGKPAQFANLYANMAYKETLDEKLLVGGKDAHVIGFQYAYKNVLTIETKQIWIITDGKVYTVTFTSVQEMWDKNNALFTAVTKTLKVPD